MTDNEQEDTQREAARDRKAKHRHDSRNENRAIAERVNREIVKAIQQIGESFGAKESRGQAARRASEHSLGDLLDKVARKFPARERRRIFIRLKLDPAEFVDEKGSLKDRPRAGGSS
jgi:hypothetical protein